MQYFMQYLSIPDSITYLIVKITVLVLVALVWMLVIVHPAY
jgi:hypothetical protein